MPAEEKLTVRVAAPELVEDVSVIIEGVTVPAEVDSVTVPVKPLTALTVIVELTFVPGAMLLNEVGLAVTVKSVTTTGTASMCVMAPLVAVMVAV